MLHVVIHIQRRTHYFEDCVLIVNAHALVPRIEFFDVCSIVACEEMDVAHTCGLLAHLNIDATTNDNVDALFDVENLTLQ